jgi:hypothetical protein
MIFSMMEHRSVKFDVRQIEPSRWIWIILRDDPVISPDPFLTRERAVEACINEINNGTERTPTPAHGLMPLAYLKQPQNNTPVRGASSDGGMGRVKVSNQKALPAAGCERRVNPTRQFIGDKVIQSCTAQRLKRKGGV